MFKSAKGFFRDESGSLTADWIVLTVGVLGFGLSTVIAVRDGADALAGDVSGALSRSSVSLLSSLGADGYTGAWVEASGRGTAYSSTQCARGGGCWTTHYVTMSYLMDDGSYWTMSSVQVDGQDAVVVWRDADGNEVDAPRFRDT